MTIKGLLTEYSLEIDDVRWYLAKLQAQRMIEYRDELKGLQRLIQFAGISGLVALLAGQPF